MSRGRLSADGRSSKPLAPDRLEAMETQLLDQQALRRALETGGLRSTPQRLAVYEHLARSECHPTVEDVYRSVRAVMPKISLATVYKALEALVEIGVATKLAAGNGTACARYDARHEPHYHFRCLQSGDVFDLPTTFDASLIAKLDPGLEAYLARQGLCVTGYRLELVGYQEKPGCVHPTTGSCVGPEHPSTGMASGS
jgi:Fe2+ or Zn2+ uptake regulation protein